MTERKIPFQAIASILAAANVDVATVSTITIDATTVKIGQLLAKDGTVALTPADIDISGGMMREKVTSYDIDYAGTAKAVAHQNERAAAFRNRDERRAAFNLKG